jgi:hypothetical protein
MLCFSMAFFLNTATDLTDDADLLRRRRFGVIDIRNGKLESIRLRPWPKFVSIIGVAWGQWYHAHLPGDRLRLYYNQPFRYPNFLALKFAVSSRHTTLATVHRALEVLDKIAQIKRSDALLCDAANFLGHAGTLRLGTSYQQSLASQLHQAVLR